MKVLSIDTASDVCGVSILDDKNLVCNLDTSTGRTHSENLMPMIEEAFKKTDLQLKDMDLLVCDKGPGSFTGIRIGIASVMAFTDSLNIPAIGISSLESLAYNTIDLIKDNTCVCSIIDCKNDNCYFALYEKRNGIFETLIEPQAESIDSTLSILNSYCDDTLDINNIIFIGDGSKIYKNDIVEIFPNAKFADEFVLDSNIYIHDLSCLNSYSLGIAGLSHYSSNIDIGNVLPLYLKKPQAQRQLEEKEKSQNI